MTKYLEFDTPAIKQAGELASYYGLENHGLRHLDRAAVEVVRPLEIGSAPGHS